MTTYTDSITLLVHRCIASARWSGTYGSVIRGRVCFFPAEGGIRDLTVTGVQTCALPIFPDACPLGAGDDEGRRRDAAGDVALACCEDPIGGGCAFLHGHRRLDYLHAMRRIQAVVASQIGRASCRGRGEISVVAGSLKKKK